MADPRNPDEIEDEDLVETDEGSDAGQIDDDGGDEAQAGQEFEGAETEERVSRGGRRDDTLRSELRAQREHNARVEAELAALRQEREQRQQQAQTREENDQEFMARISLLDPMDQMNARLDRAINRNNRQTALMAFASADRADKASYEAKAAVDAIYRKYQVQVEQTLATARRQGYSDIDRETVLDLVRGRAMRASKAKIGRGSDQGREQRQRRYAPNDMSPEAVRQRLESPDAYI
jgi:hypothetical protein